MDLWKHLSESIYKDIPLQHPVCRTDDIGCHPVTISAVIVLGVNRVLTFVGMDVQLFLEHDYSMLFCVQYIMIHC